MPKPLAIVRSLLLLPAVILASVGLIAAGAAADDPKDKRTVVPEPAAQASAEKLIRSLFKDEYAKKTPAEMLALSAKLLDQARETKDDRTARFVLFREARDLAAQAADAPLALKIVDEVAKEYAVNGLTWKVATLEKAAAATTTIPANKALVETIFSVVAEAQAADDFDVAFRLHQIAEGAAQKAKTVALVTTVQARAVQVESLRKDYEAAKLATAKLAKDPTDPPANLTAGKYLCFGKGQWDKGLPLLALGSDAKLKELAKQDLAKPGAAGAQVELADGWTEVAKGMEEPAKTNLQRRALGLYQQALPGLTGLTKTRVEKVVQAFAAPLETEKSIVNSIGMKLAYIPAGEFTMGSPDKEASRHANEGPQHKVRISKALYLGVYEVKQSEYQKVMGKNPSAFKNSPDHPVEQVNWDEAMEFCKKLSERADEKKAGRTYRLPTEAEWEYACRAGTTTAFASGDSLSSKQANFIGSAPYGGAEKGPNVGKTVRVGLYQPNAWGLFDMHGNVWEWCMDSPRAYTLNAVDDPKGLEPVTGARVMRGGSWGNDAWACRCAMRDPGHLVSFRAITIGFRVLLER